MQRQLQFVGQDLGDLVLEPFPRLVGEGQGGRVGANPQAIGGDKIGPGLGGCGRGRQSRAKKPN